MSKLFIWMYFYLEEVMLAEENKNSGTSALEGKNNTENSVCPFLYWIYSWIYSICIVYLQVFISWVINTLGVEPDAWQQTQDSLPLPACTLEATNGGGTIAWKKEHVGAVYFSHSLFFFFSAFSRPLLPSCSSFRFPMFFSRVSPTGRQIVL